MLILFGSKSIDNLLSFRLFCLALDQQLLKIGPAHHHDGQQPEEDADGALEENHGVALGEDHGLAQIGLQ